MPEMTARVQAAPVSEDWLRLLQCPETGQRLHAEANRVVTDDGTRAYDVSPSGIPLFARQGLTSDALAQQRHYDRIAGAYLANLEYPHTQE